MRKKALLTFTLVALMICTLAFATVDSAAAQNASIGGNMTTRTNMTNASIGGTSGSPAKMLLVEGIKALKNGDNEAAKTHLDAAKQVMVPGDAMKHFEEGMNDIQNGDSKGAILHLEFAAQSLG